MIRRERRGLRVEAHHTDSPLPASASPPIEIDAIDLGGTIRAIDAEGTVARARQAFGAVGISRLGNVTGLDHVGVPTWFAVRPLAKSLTVSQGKGLTHALAQASAAMESIELHHAEHFTPQGRVVPISAAALDPTFANPLLLPIRPEVNLHQGSSAEWIQGDDLGSGNRLWVPRDCVSLDSVSVADDKRLFVSSSNGLASGNTRDEAVLHALCELIERDQVSLWLARQEFDCATPNRRLRLDDVTDQSCRGLVERCNTSGVRLAVWSVNDTLPVPCFMCTAFDGHGRTVFPQWASGFGCHPYRRIALARAITEALQSRVTCIAGGRDDLTWAHYNDLIRVDNVKGACWIGRLEAEPETYCMEAIPEAPPLADIPALLRWVLAALADRGFEQAIVVDLTQQEIGIPVVHATVPGLEGMFGKAEYTPGPRMKQLLTQLFAFEPPARSIAP